MGSIATMVEAMATVGSTMVEATAITTTVAMATGIKATKLSNRKTKKRSMVDMAVKAVCHLTNNNLTTP